MEFSDFQLRQERERLDIQEELAIAEAEDQIFQDEERAASRPLHSFPSASAAILNDSSATLRPPRADQQTVIDRTPPFIAEQQYSFNTERDIINQMPPPSARPTHHISMHQPGAVSPPSRGAAPPSYDPLASAIREMAKISKHSRLPASKVQPFDGDPRDYHRFISAFKHVVEDNTDDEATRLNLLTEYTTGEAQLLVKGCQQLPHDQGFSKAMELLASNFGNANDIAQSIINDLLTGPSVQAGDVSALTQFSRDLQRAELTLRSLNYTSDINSVSNLKQFAGRLPTPLRSKWSYKSYKISMQSSSIATFADFSAFVLEEARVAASAFGDIGNKKKPPYIKPLDQKRAALATQASSAPVVTMATNSNSPSARAAPKCFVCSGSHPLYRCEAFIKMPLADRSKAIKESRRCFNCFRSHHIKDCDSRARCKECNRKHHSLLHNPNGPSQEADQRPTADKPAPNVKQTVGMTSTQSLVFLRILPIRVTCGNKSVHTLAMLDDGSQATLCSESLIQRLNAKTRPASLTLITLSGETEVQNSRMLDLSVRGISTTENMALKDVRSVKNLPINTEAAAHLSDTTLQHLQEPIRKIQDDCRAASINNSHPVELLIGGCDSKAFWVDKELRGNPNEAFAQLTKLGWTVQGPSGSSHPGSSPHVHFVQTEHPSTDIQRLFNADFPERQHTDETAMSIDDRKALSLVEESVTEKDGHLEIGMPWRVESSEIPNNRNTAEKRLGYLKKKLQADAPLKEKYSAAIQEYLDSGYAEPVPNDAPEPTHGVWYIPHHGVINPNKAKLRVVFDCAAQYRGKSLNDYLYQGPDFMNSLVGILLRFREKPFAIAADIKAMFSQVRAKPADHELQRFLWFPGGDLSLPAERFRMTRHIFGATSSPFVACYALRQAMKHTNDDQVKSTILKDFYVDDLLTSCDSAEEAAALGKSLITPLSNIGFELTKFVANSECILAQLPPEKLSPSVQDLDIEAEEAIDRTLGLRWLISEDAYSFKVKLQDRPNTRRGVLSIASSIYDPLGFVAPATLLPKRLLQMFEGGWDDSLPEALSNKWEAWKNELSGLENIRVPRCYLQHTNTPCDLHVFSDASEVAYGTVIYLRTCSPNPETAFVLGKSRVAPKKTVSIPRLELNAAAMACKLTALVQTQLRMKPNDVVYWTDSMAVLRFIRNTTSRFKVFVANRLAVIHEYTRPSQWKYISTAENPADLASRGFSPQDTNKLSTWLRGPFFLSHDPIIAPQPNVKSHEPEREEQSEQRKTVALTLHGQSASSQLIERWSSYEKLLRCTAYLKRLPDCLSLLKTKKQAAFHLTAAELSSAERALIRNVQTQAFTPEITALKQNKCVSSRSRPNQLAPFIDPDGLLRVGGRLKRINPQQFNKHPIILPRCRFAELLIKSIHRSNAHAGAIHTLCALRKKFWLLNATSAVKQVIRQCLPCRKQFSSPCIQQMSDLPLERIEAGKPPFTNIGIDYFGPFEVKVGRSYPKRYGVLITCLVTRAVHLEVAHSLTTDPFLASFSRFAARRGHPQVVYSDNGTNIVSGEKELRKMLHEFNQKQINNHMTQRQITWHFLPPHASHMPAPGNDSSAQRKGSFTPSQVSRN